MSVSRDDSPRDGFAIRFVYRCFLDSFCERMGLNPACFEKERPKLFIKQLRHSCLFPRVTAAPRERMGGGGEGGGGVA